MTKNLTTGGSLFPPLLVATTYRRSKRRSAVTWSLIRYLRAWLKQVESQSDSGHHHYGHHR